MLWEKVGCHVNIYLKKDRHVEREKKNTKIMKYIQRWKTMGHLAWDSAFSLVDKCEPLLEVLSNQL